MLAGNFSELGGREGNPAHPACSDQGSLEEDVSAKAALDFGQ